MYMTKYIYGVSEYVLIPTFFNNFMHARYCKTIMVINFILQNGDW
jgi:hypothetical protein